MGGSSEPESHAAVLALLDAGVEVSEGTLVRCLRSPACPRALVERLAGCRFVRGLRRVPPLLLRHPGCPRTFAWDMLPRIGWHDVLLVVRDPRTAPPIRRQAERKLVERLKQLTVGERTALARQATPGVIAGMLGDGAPACVRALLDNPRFTEQDAVRLLGAAANGECAAAVVRHPGWGSRRAVVDAALRAPALPLGVALGVLASLPRTRLEALARGAELPQRLREPLHRLLERRRGGDTAAAGAGGGSGGEGGGDPPETGAEW